MAYLLPLPPLPRFLHFPWSPGRQLEHCFPALMQEQLEHRPFLLHLQQRLRDVDGHHYTINQILLNSYLVAFLGDNPAKISDPAIAWL